MLRLNPGEFIHPVLTELHEAIDAGEAVAGHQVLDVALGLQAEFFFDFDFNP